MSSLRAPSGADVDPYLYLDPPLLDASGLLALGQALLDGAPLSPPPSLLSPLRRLRQACDDLQTMLRQAREAPPPLLPRPESRQPADFALDNAWTALYERLRAYVMLPESEVPRVKRAHELLRLLFPDALGFLRLPYDAEWTESDKRLRSVEKLSLVPDLDAVAGPEFLAEVRRAHELYSRALGRRPEGSASGDNERAIAKDHSKDHSKDHNKDLRDSGENPALRDLRLHLARCISTYAVKVLSLTPDDVKDYQVVKRWLAPLSAYQRAESRKGNALAPSSKATTGAAHSPSLHDWASNLRAADSSGDHKPLSESGLVRAIAVRPMTAAAAPASASSTATAQVAPASGQRPSSLGLATSDSQADSRHGGQAGQSGTYRPLSDGGQSGTFRPIKRPPP